MLVAMVVQPFEPVQQARACFGGYNVVVLLAQIAEEIGARYEDTLRDDDLPGAPGDAEHSWMGLMRYDYVTMIKGLGGTAPTLEALDVADIAPDSADYPQ